MKKAKYKIWDKINTDIWYAEIIWRKYQKKDNDFPWIEWWWYEIDYIDAYDEVSEDIIY